MTGQRASHVLQLPVNIPQLSPGAEATYSPAKGITGCSPMSYLAAGAQSIAKPSGCHAGSTQGIGLGMLRGLEEAGADVAKHGLMKADEAKAKTAEIAIEFGVQCQHSAADVTKPAKTRYLPLAFNHCCRQVREDHLSACCYSQHLE